MHAQRFQGALRGQRERLIPQSPESASRPIRRLLNSITNVRKHLQNDYQKFEGASPSLRGMFALFSQVSPIAFGFPDRCSHCLGSVKAIEGCIARYYSWIDV